MGLYRRDALRAAIMTILAASTAVTGLQHTDIISLARNIDMFSANVYQELSSGSGNLLMCPLSVQCVLALVQSGAHGETFDQMTSSLSLPQDRNTTRELFRNLVPAIQSNNGKVELLMANRVFARKGFAISPEFRSTARTSFWADIQNLDFGQAAASANEISRWVARRTKNKITDLIKASDVNANTQMVLVNALYFNGFWAKSFHKGDTFKQPFYTAAGNDSQLLVDMMHQAGRFRYAENGELDAKFLELPYAGYDYSMTVVLPNKRDGLRDLEAHVHQVLQPQLYSSSDVQISLPRFRIEDTIHFNDVLHNLGMKDAFTDRADFRYIGANKERLSISNVVQKTYMEVTEEGTQAAAASAVAVITLSIPAQIQKVKFQADHPFMFMLKNRKFDAAVFVGRYTGPG